MRQLSLEVKGQNGLTSSDHPIKQQQVPKHETQRDGSSSEEIPDRMKQISEFDHSIETLLVQLSDLEQPSLEISVTPLQQRRSRFSYSSHQSIQHPHLASSTSRFSTSLETSQEEDSDCSSSTQQSSAKSSYNTTESSPMQPLVRSLLKRDLDDITNVIRKLGHILTLGSQVAAITKITGPNPYIDQCYYARSLCDKFINLYHSERFMEDLPTLRSYYETCQHLLDRLNIQQNQPDISVEMLIESDIDSESMMDSDKEFLTNYEQIANWTDNRLYIDSAQQNSASRFYGSSDI